ncbi:MAG: hypothetical protein H0T68_13585 [Gemmatimonadales bacterium]|nr:hypothetical protein [Gemmatimonadales bacterium]
MHPIRRSRIVGSTRWMQRSAPPTQRRHWERLADGVFLFALTLTGAICVLIAYELI